MYPVRIPDNKGRIEHIKFFHAKYSSRIVRLRSVHYLETFTQDLIVSTKNERTSDEKPKLDRFNQPFLKIELESYVSCKCTSWGHHIKDQASVI